VFDPYRTCVGLAAAAAARDAMVFERTEVLRVRAQGKAIELITAGGAVRGGTVIIAGGTGIPDLAPLRRHLRPRHGYGVVTEPLAAPVRREVGARNTVLRERASSPRFVRWLKEDRVMIAGDAQDPMSGRARDQAVVQRTGQLMYELSLMYPAISGTRPAWGWSSAFDETVDGLPYIGPHRNFPRHLFALGVARHGAGAAWLAARLLLRQIVGEPLKGDELLGFSRILQGHH
jgi:glycine/D-amino acid oxidase-like deaminating enzyme